MDHVRMRALAEGLGALAERLEGGWRVEIGPADPALSLRRRPKRHTGVLRRLRTQLDEQLRTTHPGHICAAPHIAHPSLGRMRHPDAALASTPAPARSVHSDPCKGRYARKAGS
ncbi:hypothetical protein ACIG53_27765 [Streptomyces bauhiniae]|uniref:hypothetical protein n=1 Tax=Streptomyces bauhiniae TaxID=2340725 RepID=UPI0037D66BE3